MASLESVLAGLIVIGCAGFSLWRLLSARWRLRFLDALPGRLGRPDHAWTARMRSKALAELSGGCGACSRAPRTLTAIFPRANRRSGAPPR